ncbi:hypothetical protein [Actinomadura sp. 21ATH]|uniref:hypothetical protein n=1 Tax=Actinomadura sp. 21ATH TaxID=1735444 RepID=UPI0035C00598
MTSTQSHDRLVPDSASPADAASRPPDPPAAGPRRGAAVLAVVMAVSVAAPAGTAWTLAGRAERGRETVRDAEAARAVAQTGARDILSYDHRTLEADVGRAGRLMTPGFRRKYEALMRGVTAPQARRDGAVVQSEAVASGVESAVPGRVVVLLYIDQWTVKRDDRAPRIDQQRARLTLVERGSRWLVDDITTPGPPG